MFNTETVLELSEEQILANPSTSNWLRRAILESRNRDILDAIDDAQCLASLLEKRWTEMVASPPAKG